MRILERIIHIRRIRSVWGILAIALAIGIFELWSYWSYDLSLKLGGVHFKGELTSKLSEALETVNEWETRNSVNVAELREGMRLLAQAGHPRARLAAIQMSKSSRNEIREVAAVGLGYAQDGDKRAIKKLWKLLADPEETVRAATIEALGSVSTPGRERLIQKAQKAGEKLSFSKSEKVQLLASMHRAATTEAGKKEALDAIIEYARTGEVRARRAAMLLTLQLASDRVENQEIIRRAVHSRDAETVASAIGALARHRDPWLRGKLDPLSKHPDRMVRLAVIGAIHYLCPDDRWNVLKVFAEIERDDELLIAVLREARILSGPISKTFVEDFLNAGKGGAYSDSVVKEATAVFDELKRSSRAQDSCT